MILYSVTINIENEVQEEWLHWMKTVHIPDVLGTGLFRSHKVLRLLTEEDNGGTTYSCQYFLENMQNFEYYQEFHATRLQAEHNGRYAGRFVSFRTLLEMVDQSPERETPAAS